ncbi:MAG: glycosyltransferase family 4 protein [Gemmatimonadaceae bacterium]
MPERAGPLRVVHVSFHADRQRRDGDSLLRAWPTLSSVAAGVARAGVDVTVVQTANADETIQRDGIDFQFVNDATPRRARVTTRVMSLEPDVVHVQGLHHGRAVRSLARAAHGTPVLVQDHGNVEPKGWRRAAWTWAFRSISGAAFTVGEQAAPWIASGVLRPTLPLFDVLEGSSSFTPGDQGAAQRATRVFGDQCVLWTSRLDANKDPFTLLEAIERAIPCLPDLRLWCCFGRAPLLHLVHARIAASEVLRERVTLLGARPHDEIERLLRAADFYIQTSHREGSGYSLLEALSCGTPPVATDIPATRFIVGDAGSLTPVGDARAMADALVALAGRDATDLRTRARARFESELTFDAIGRQLRHAYESLVESCAS